MRNIINKRLITIIMTIIFSVVFLSVNETKAIETGIPGVPTISHNQYEGDFDGDFDIKIDMWHGNNATKYKLYERYGTEGEFKVIKDVDLKDNSPQPQNIVAEIRNKDVTKAGVYYYYVEFINSAGKSISNTVSIKIGTGGSGSQGATGAPNNSTIQGNQFGEDLDGNYDIELNLWSGNNGTSYKVHERIGHIGEFSVVQEGELVDSTPSRQQEFIQIRGRTIPATYYYYIEVINKYGNKNSNTITIKVGINDESKIIITGIDAQTQKMQAVIKQGVSEYKLTNILDKAPNYSIKLNNSSVLKASIVNGDTLRLEGLKAGRSGLQIIDEVSGEIRKIGIKVQNNDGTNPGMPDYLSIGSVSEDTPADLEFWKDIDSDDTNKRMDVRYIYINGGPLEEGWKNWTTNEGDRVKVFLRESLKMGVIPFFVFYNIPAGGESYVTNLENIQSGYYMEEYYKNLKFFIDLCHEYGEDELIGIIFEPDFLGYIMQNSGISTKDVEARVDSAYSSGILNKDEDPVFDNTVQGLVTSINYVVNKYMPDAYNGWQYNTWSYAKPGVPEIGLMHATERMGMDKGREFIKGAAKATADYYVEAGVNSYNAEFISVDKYGLDGAYERAGLPNSAGIDPRNSMWFWNADLWNNYLLYVEELGKASNKPVILWQLPVGRINSSKEPNPYTGGGFKDLENVDMKYEDSSTSFFFGDTFTPGSNIRHSYFSENLSKDPKIKVNGNTVTWGGHMEEAKDAGIVSILFGAGVGMSTDAVGAPPTDDYWWITKAQRYLKSPIKLDVVIKIDEDVNKDNTVNILDLAMVSTQYNTRIKDLSFKLNHDINNDGIIDLLDLVRVGKKFNNIF